jgi:hypothetical protein
MKSHPRSKNKNKMKTIMKNMKSFGALFGKKIKEYEYKYDRNIDDESNIK